MTSIVELAIHWHDRRRKHCVPDTSCFAHLTPHSLVRGSPEAWRRRKPRHSIASAKVTIGECHLWARWLTRLA